MIGIIGGSGVGQAIERAVRGTPHDIDTPFGKPSAPLMIAEWEKCDVAFLARHGKGHVYPPSAVPFRANIWALKSLGVKHIIASGATGSLREEIRPRDLVVPSQVIDKTTCRTGTFFDEPGIVAHCEFADPFCPMLRKRLLGAAVNAATTVHDGGTYVCMEGPAFSTIAESRMHRAWGGDLIGMTCMPEAKLAREAEMCYCMIALATDYDCWRPHASAADRKAVLDEIMENFHVATESGIALLAAALRDFAAAPPEDCECQHSLERAIWSDRGQLDARDKSRLGLLVAKYLS